MGPRTGTVVARAEDLGDDCLHAIHFKDPDGFSGQVNVAALSLKFFSSNSNRGKFQLKQVCGQGDSVKAFATSTKCGWTCFTESDR